MAKILHILMIDDHPSVIEGYKSILSFNTIGLTFKVTPAYNCETAYNIIEDANSNFTFHFAFVDLSLPPYLEKNIKGGEDLALLIKNKFPKCKIVILTSHAEAYILDTIQKNIDPIGILIKSDFTADEFLEAFEKMYKNEIYKSKTANTNISEFQSINTMLDEIDIKLITLLSQGVKTKSLPQYLGLTISAIDKRKRHIKLFFKIIKGGDEDILFHARKNGYL